MPVSNNGDDQEAYSSTEPLGVRNCLTLKSPFGSLKKVYDWPLRKGRGNIRKSEDKEDEAAEIFETIKYVCEDHPEVREFMNAEYPAAKTTPDSYDSMLGLCSTYNRAIENMISTQGLPTIKERTGRANRSHLKHIMQQCYNKSVDDPNELNHYEPFTPEVYGETSFELICQILDRLHPIADDNQFIDLGSGVGQVVLQVAALTGCKMSIGIEKAKAPSKFARAMTKNFEFWMEFYGKKYSNFNLAEGDFLDSKFREEILGSTIIFVNNFAFGPEVDQRLKDIFADLADGSRIFSSKSFCALNFRITDRNLSDIGTIMHVSKMDPLKGSVSWTGKPVSYYLHVIDRAKLERFFQKSAARKGEEKKNGRRTARHNPNSSMDDQLSTRDHSRASSVDQDDATRDSALSSERLTNGNGSSELGTTNGSEPGTRNVSEDESHHNAQTGLIDGPNRVSSSRPTRRKGRKTAKKKKLRTSKPRAFLLNHQKVDTNHYDGFNNVNTSSSSASTTSSPPHSTSSSPSHSEFEAVPGVSNARPVRAAVANAAAISVAQQDMNHTALKSRGRTKKVLESTTLPPPSVIPPSVASRKKLVKAQPIPSAAALNLLHTATMDSINASNRDSNAPSGCVNVRLQINNMPELKHEELPVSLNTDDQGREIPLELRMYLERVKNDYLRFMDRMKCNDYRNEVEKELRREMRRKTDLVNREKQLDSQVENLISEALALLKARLEDLGIQAKTPPEFIEKAKLIVSNHHELQQNQTDLENEITNLERLQPKMIAKREKELIEETIKISGLSRSEVKALVRRKIDSVLTNRVVHRDSKGNPILGLSSDVILTKCHSDQLPPSTQIRKRPRDSISKQRDWPEKRIKDSVTVSPIKNSNSSSELPSDRSKVIANVAPEQNINFENTMTSHLSTVNSLRQNPSVEVRKIEYPPNGPVPYKSSRSLTPPRYDQKAHLSSGLELPKMDISMSMLTSGMIPTNDQQLILPSHPHSRSGSSDPNENVTFASQKMSSTPRAEQFEDRLKTIIHSVLTGDGDQDIKPPLALPPRGVVNSQTHPHNQRQGKKDHPTNSLPNSRDSPNKKMLDLSAFPNSSSGRTIHDLIASEIEKSLSVNGPGSHVGFHNSSPFGGLPGKTSAPSPSPGSQASTMSRVSQVIEDSIRGKKNVNGTKELEGLACPRTRSPTSRNHPLRPSTSSPLDHPGDAALHGRYSAPLPGQFWPGGPHHLPEGAYHPHLPRSFPSENYHSKRSPPLASPSLPPKKQLTEDYRMSRDEDFPQQSWQDEISTGFDRLMAYATEVDKRRRSPDSDVCHRSGLDGRRRLFERTSTLSMKFKSAPSPNLNFPRGAVGSVTYGSNNRAVSSISSPVDFDSPSPQGSNDSLSRHSVARSPIPGENLPEHHFKKRYFAESREVVGKAESPFSARRRVGDENSGRPDSRHSSKSSNSSQIRDYMDDNRKTSSPTAMSSLVENPTLP